MAEKCKKTRYETEAEAQAALNVIAPRMGDFTMRPYRCSCGWWHFGHSGMTKDKKREAVIKGRLALLQNGRGGWTSKEIGEFKELTRELKEIKKARKQAQEVKNG